MSFSFPLTTYADVYSLYPDQPIMAELAANNNPHLLRYLEGSYSYGVSNAKVLAAVTAQDLAELQALARLEVRKQQLHKNCADAYQAFRAAHDPEKKTVNYAV